VNLVSPPRTANDQRPVPDRNDMLREYNDIQSTKRKVYPPVPQSANGSYEQPDKRRKLSLYEQEAHPRSGPRPVVEHPHMREYQPTATRSRHRAHPSQEIVDLTSSPRQPPFGRVDDFYTTRQSYPAAGPSNYAFAPEAPRRSPVRNDHHEYPVGGQPRAYIPESDRMYQRRPAPAHEYIPLRR
jgi:hypothetical protein